MTGWIVSKRLPIRTRPFVISGSDDGVTATPRPIADPPDLRHVEGADRLHVEQDHRNVQAAYRREKRFGICVGRQVAKDDVHPVPLEEFTGIPRSIDRIDETGSDNLAAASE